MNLRNTRLYFRFFSPNTVNFNYHRLHHQYNCIKWLGLQLYLALCDITTRYLLLRWPQCDTNIVGLFPSPAANKQTQHNTFSLNTFSTQNKSRKLFLAIFSWRGIWRVSNLSEQNNFHKEAKFVAPHSYTGQNIYRAENKRERDREVEGQRYRCIHMRKHLRRIIGPRCRNVSGIYIVALRAVARPD